MGKKEKILEIGLSDEQMHAMAVLTDPREKAISRVIYGGQAGGGKSFLICLWLHSMAKMYPGTRYYLSRERLKDIKESVLLTFWDVLKLDPGFKLHYNATSSILTYPNRSQIYLVECFAYPSDPNFDSLGSREYTAGAIEEGITVTKRAADILLSRTRYKHDVYGLFPKQLITCNPGDGWIKDDIVIPSIEGRHTKHNEIFIRATLDSNPNKSFRERYAQTLEENLSAFDRARLLHGDWNARPKTGAEYLKDFNPDIHAVPETRYDKNLPIHIAFDENVHPYITCEIWQVQVEGKMRYATQIDEICQKPPKNSRKHVCAEVLRRYGSHTAGAYVYGDATSWKGESGAEYGENFFTDIIKYLAPLRPGLRVPGKNPPVMSKAGFLNLIFEKSYRDICIRIDRKCKLSIADYSHSLEDVNGGILKLRVKDPQTGITFERDGHHIDAMSYFICEAFIADFNYYLGGDWKPLYETGSEREYKFER
jgi:hypothetical protein